MNLFDPLDDEHRAQLAARGWSQVDYHGLEMWRKPDGGLVSFAEAVRWLEGQQKLGGKTGD